MTGRAGRSGERIEIFRYRSGNRSFVGVQKEMVAIEKPDPEFIRSVAPPAVDILPTNFRIAQAAQHGKWTAQRSVRRIGERFP